MAYRAGKRKRRIEDTLATLATSVTPAAAAALAVIEKLSDEEIDQVAAVLRLRPSSFAHGIYRTATEPDAGSRRDELSLTLVCIVRRWQLEIERRNRKTSNRERDAHIAHTHDREGLSFGQIAKRLDMSKEAVAKAYQREKARAELGRA
jgi:hypothetical protein